jgi:hypothetical protein
VTTPGLVYLSFPVENAILSDLVASGQTILPVVVDTLAQRRKRPHAPFHDDAQLPPGIVNQVSTCDLKISLSPRGWIVPAYNDCAIWDIE